MNPFTKHHAQTKAGRLAQAARRAALACVLVLGAGGAIAQQHGDRRDDQVAQQGMQENQGRGKFWLPQQDRDPRQQRDGGRGGYEDNRPQQADQPDRQQGRGGRMTPDERRDLRRQINEAGMDLYQRRR